MSDITPHFKRDEWNLLVFTEIRFAVLVEPGAFSKNVVPAPIPCFALYFQDTTQALVYPEALPVITSRALGGDEE